MKPHFLIFLFSLNFHQIYAGTEHIKYPIDGCKDVQKFDKNIPFYERFSKNPDVKSLLSIGESRYGDSLDDGRTLPKWLDVELAFKGQEFAIKNSFIINYSHSISLYILLVIENIRKVLFLTGKSHTWEIATLRYTATSAQVNLWYKEPLSFNFSSPFFKSVNNIRQIHNFMGRFFERNMTNFMDMEIKAANSNRPMSPLYVAFQNDLLRTKLKYKRRKDNEISNNLFKQCRLSQKAHCQYSMALTQWAFVALPVLIPEKLGIHKSTPEEQKAFIHLWAGLGWMLGIEDAFNLCISRDLEETKYILRQILVEVYFEELFMGIDLEKEIMWNALVKALVRILPLLSEDYILVFIIEDLMGSEAIYLRRHIKYESWHGRFISFFFRNLINPLSEFKFYRNVLNYLGDSYIKIANLNSFGFDGKNSSQVAEKAYYNR